MRARWFGVVFASAMAGGFPAVAQPSPTSITAEDFVAGFRKMSGVMVLVDSCTIGGTTRDFIRCETDDDRSSFALTSESLKAIDRDFANSFCPTGSRDKPGCRLKVIGMVKATRTVPELTDAHFVRP